jgi:hypothetical protein
MNYVITILSLEYVQLRLQVTVAAGKIGYLASCMLSFLPEALEFYSSLLCDSLCSRWHFQNVTHLSCRVSVVIANCWCAAFSLVFINVTSTTYFDLMRSSSGRYFNASAAMYCVFQFIVLEHGLKLVPVTVEF